jgi:hypothetical protein
VPLAPATVDAAKEPEHGYKPRRRAGKSYTPGARLPIDEPARQDQARSGREVPGNPGESEAVGTGGRKLEAGTD